MALNETQLAVIIQGVRSICDELLNMDEADPGPYAPDPALTIPPATAPPATAPPAAPPVENPQAPPLAADVDTEGIPWDERIHTAKKSKLKSGVWRLKPGADAVLVAKVKSELTLAATVPPATVPPATAPPAAPAGAMTWSDLLNKIVEASKAPDEVLRACTACGVENIGKLQDNLELIPSVAMVLGLQ